jgi:hypothetical protein
VIQAKVCQVKAPSQKAIRRRAKVRSASRLKATVAKACPRTLQIQVKVFLQKAHKVFRVTLLTVVRVTQARVFPQTQAKVKVALRQKVFRKVLRASRHTQAKVNQAIHHKAKVPKANQAQPVQKTIPKAHRSQVGRLIQVIV